MCANSEGSGETARMRKLAWAFAGRFCDKYHNLSFAGRKYHNLMSWLKCFGEVITADHITGPNIMHKSSVANVHKDIYLNKFPTLKFLILNIPAVTSAIKRIFRMWVSVVMK